MGNKTCYSGGLMPQLELNFLINLYPLKKFVYKDWLGLIVLDYNLSLNIRLTKLLLKC